MAKQKKNQPVKSEKDLAKKMSLSKLLNTSNGGIIETVPGRFAKIYKISLDQDISDLIKYNPSKCDIQIWACSMPRSSKAAEAYIQQNNIPEEFLNHTLYKTGYFLILSIKAPMPEAEKSFKTMEEKYGKILEALSSKAILNLLHIAYNPGNIAPAADSDPDFKGAYKDFLVKIAPDTLKCTQSGVYINGNKIDTIMVSDFPVTTPATAYMDITQIGCPMYVSVHYSKINKEKMIAYLKSKIESNEENAPRQKTPVLSENKRESYEYILSRLLKTQDSGECVYNVSTYISLTSPDEEERKKSVELIKFRTKRYGINLIDSDGQARDAWDASLPIGYSKCKVSSALYSDEYKFYVPSGNIIDAFSSGVYYAKDAETNAPILIDREKLGGKVGFILGSENSGAEKLIKREIDYIRKDPTNAVIILDANGKIDVDGDRSDVTKYPLFPSDAPYNIKCTLLGNLIRAMIDKIDGLSQKEADELNRIFGELKQDYSFLDFEKLVLDSEFFREKFTEFFGFFSPNQKNKYIPSESRCLIFDFSAVENNNPYFSVKNTYFLEALAAAYYQSMINKAKGLKTYIYIDGFDAGTHKVKNAKLLTAILKQNESEAMFTLSTSNIGVITDGIKRDVKGDGATFSVLSTIFIESPFVALFNVNPSYRRSLWYALDLHYAYQSYVAAEKDAGIIHTSFRTMPFKI